MNYYNVEATLKLLKMRLKLVELNITQANEKLEKLHKEKEAIAAGILFHEFAITDGEKKDDK